MTEPVKYHKIASWGWTCTECGIWNEEANNPADKDFLFCEYCKAYFKPVEAE